MIKEIDLDTLNYLEDSFLVSKGIKEEIKNNPFAKVLIYVESKKVIGYLYYSDIYDRIEINNFEVLKDFRRQKIGSSLLEKLISKDKNITLEVKEDNIAAINIYKKYGFEQVAIREKYYKDKDGILMERKCLVKS